MDIRKYTAFNSLSDKDLANVQEHMEFIDARMGSVIFIKGDNGDNVYFLVEGKIELSIDEESSIEIFAGTKDANNTLGESQPYQFTAKAVTHSRLFQLKKEIFYKFSPKSEGDNIQSENEESKYDDEDKSIDWMTRVLQSNLLSSIPSANIQQLFSLFEAENVKKDDLVITQGEQGDYFYIIQKGECQVIRTINEKDGKKNKVVAKLKAGNYFGEEALIGNIGRNASVKMTSNGVLMKLAKNDFIKLVKDPAVKSITLKNALELVDEDAIWIDVRFANEYEINAIENSINIPINRIRLSADKLDKNKKYVIYCDNGARSSIASFLLSRLDLETYVLDGGLEKQSYNSELNLIANNDITDFENESEKGSHVDTIVRKILSAGKNDERALTHALGDVMNILYKELEQAMQIKINAEDAKQVTNEKMKDLIQRIQ